MSASNWLASLKMYSCTKCGDESPFKGTCPDCDALEDARENYKELLARKWQIEDEQKQLILENQKINQELEQLRTRFGINTDFK